MPLIIQISILIVALGVLGLAVGASRPSPELEVEGGWLEEIVHRQIVVHTTESNTFHGLLESVWDDGLLLKAVRMVDADVALAGDVFVPRAMIAFVQREE